jgi:hypothetical protein
VAFLSLEEKVNEIRERSVDRHILGPDSIAREPALQARYAEVEEEGLPRVYILVDNVSVLCFSPRFSGYALSLMSRGRN